MSGGDYDQRKQKSNCCGAEMKIEGGDEGTMFYRCLSCFQPCDPASDKFDCGHMRKFTHKESGRIKEFKKCPYCVPKKEVKKICKKCGEYEYDCICASYNKEVKVLKEELRQEKSRVQSLVQTMGFACHLLALGITGYREKKGAPEECLLESVDKATKKYASLISPKNDCLSDFEFRALVIWMKDKNRKPANTAFTQGACRDTARAFEMYLEFLKDIR